MPSYKSLAQILITISVASSALTAPTVSPSETASTAASKDWGVGRTSAAVGLIAGLFGSIQGVIQKGINAVTPHYNSNGTFSRAVEEMDNTSPYLTDLTDNHLLFLRDISHRALESLD